MREATALGIAEITLRRARKALGGAGRRLVDGRGAIRVAAAIRSLCDSMPAEARDVA